VPGRYPDPVSDNYDLDGALGYWIHLTFNKMRAAGVRDVFEPAGLSPEQWVILVRLWEQDDQRQQDLADSTLRDKTVVARMLNVLEREGYVRRARDREDGRAHRILLTAKGRELEDVLVPQVRAFIENMTRGVSTRDLETTRRTLRRLYDNLG
jgi:DNA-binding MarR family transcriptional regulator